MFRYCYIGIHALYVLSFGVCLELSNNVFSIVIHSSVTVLSVVRFRKDTPAPKQASYAFDHIDTHICICYVVD